MNRPRSASARLTACLAVLVACAALPALPSARADGEVVTARASTRGDTGRFVFADRGGRAGGTCVYDKGRLTAVRLTAPRASGRPQWEPTGQYVLWGAQLQSRTGQGRWRNVGGVHYSDPLVGHAGTPQRLKPASIPRVFGSTGTSYRVVETINWYFNNRNRPIVQGQATQVLGHLSAKDTKVATCRGTLGASLVPSSVVRNDELDAVDVSFAGKNADSTTRYRLAGGALPKGLVLGARSGRVTGTITVGAADVTTNYRTIRSRSMPFTIAARAHGTTTKRSYTWKVFDTAFVMEDYYGRYGCGHPCGEPVRQISHLGPLLPFGCSNDPQPGIPAERTGVIYRQDYQTSKGKLARSTGGTFRYGDIFKWWYYPCS